MSDPVTVQVFWFVRVQVMLPAFVEILLNQILIHVPLPPLLLKVNLVDFKLGRRCCLHSSISPFIFGLLGADSSQVLILGEQGVITNLSSTRSTE